MEWNRLQLRIEYCNGIDYNLEFNIAIYTLQIRIEYRNGIDYNLELTIAMGTLILQCIYYKLRIEYCKGELNIAMI